MQSYNQQHNPNLRGNYQSPTGSLLSHDFMKFGGNISGNEGMYQGMLKDGSIGKSGSLLDFKPGGVQGAVNGGELYGNFDAGGVGISANDIMGGVGFGMNMVNMFKNWDLQDSMLDMAKSAEKRAGEQWGITKEEMSRIANVRKNVQAGYQNGGNYAEQAQKNPTNVDSQYL